jgi:hypothetical protein
LGKPWPVIAAALDGNYMATNVLVDTRAVGLAALRKAAISE